MTSTFKPLNTRGGAHLVRNNRGRILVSHAGNLPRPDFLDSILLANGVGSEYDRAAYAAKLPEAVKWIVQRQIDCGVDVVNDGEYVKAGSYGGYLHERITGFSNVPYDPERPAKRGGTAERD